MTDQHNRDELEAEILGRVQMMNDGEKGFILAIAEALDDVRGQPTEDRFAAMLDDTTPTGILNIKRWLIEFDYLDA